MQTNKIWYKTLEPKQAKQKHFTFEESKLEFGKQFFDKKVLYQVMFVHILAEIFKGSHFEFLSRKLSGETLCKLLQIFPPKVLVYI